MVRVVIIAGVEVSEHILAAGLIAVFMAAQSLRNALWSHGFALRETGRRQAAVLFPARA